jgi:Flp pilus assembly protein TadB
LCNLFWTCGVQKKRARRAEGVKEKEKKRTEEEEKDGEKIRHRRKAANQSFWLGDIGNCRFSASL